jgi:hypothetical protein
MEPHSGAMVDATFFVKSDASMDTPDLHTFFGEFVMSSPENTRRFALPAHRVGFFGTICHPITTRERKPCRLHAR